MSALGRDKPRELIDRDDLMDLLARVRGTGGIGIPELADRILALAKPIGGILLTNEEANRAWDWAMRLQEESDGLTPEDRALADNLRVAL